MKQDYSFIKKDLEDFVSQWNKKCCICQDENAAAIMGDSKWIMTLVKNLYGAAGITYNIDIVVTSSPFHLFDTVNNYLDSRKVFGDVVPMKRHIYRDPLIELKNKLSCNFKSSFTSRLDAGIDFPHLKRHEWEITKELKTNKSFPENIESLFFKTVIRFPHCLDDFGSLLFLRDKQWGPAKNPLMDALVGLTCSCGWIVPFQTICFVSLKPVEIHVDFQSKLHSENGPAMRFNDGFCLYRKHGACLSSEIVHSLTSTECPFCYTRNDLKPTQFIVNCKKCHQTIVL